MSYRQQIGEHEAKYTLPNSRAVLLWSWLHKKCRPDPLYCEGIVSSIYFDTRELDMLSEKLNSTYLKTKIRLRWYSEATSGAPFPTVFLEVKGKVGSARVKERLTMDFEAGELVRRELSDQFYRNINELLIRHGLFQGQVVFPVLQIDYRRTRYVEPHTGARISLDRDIACSRVNWSLAGRLNKRPLPSAVLEYKDKTGTLPEQLNQVTALAGCRRGAFSKYSECYAHIFS